MPVSSNLKSAVGSIAEHRLDDVRHGHLLEDAAVGRPRQEPEPRADDRGVAVVAAVALPPGENRVTKPLKYRVLSSGSASFTVTFLPRISSRLMSLLRAEQIELVLAQPAHLLARVHAVEQQHVVAERRDDLHRL